jgi:hypothetical protein
MTLTQFRDEATILALPYGLNQNAITTIAGIYGHHSSSCMYYSIKAWDNKKLCHIESDLYKNPESALQGFKDELDKHFKQYDTTETDIVLM